MRGSPGAEEGLRIVENLWMPLRRGIDSTIWVSLIHPSRRGVRTRRTIRKRRSSPARPILAQALFSFPIFKKPAQRPFIRCLSEERASQRGTSALTADLPCRQGTRAQPSGTISPSSKTLHKRSATAERRHGSSLQTGQRGTSRTVRLVSPGQPGQGFFYPYPYTRTLLTRPRKGGKRADHPDHPDHFDVPNATGSDPDGNAKQAKTALSVAYVRKTS